MDKTAQQQRVYSESEVEQMIIEAGFGAEPATQLLERAAAFVAMLLWRTPDMASAKKWMEDYHEWKNHPEQVPQHERK